MQKSKHHWDSILPQTKWLSSRKQKMTNADKSTGENESYPLLLGM
jgi:hypothetical protein